MQFSQTISIEGKLIQNGSPTFIIAEAGVNHGGDMDVAKKLVDLAAEAGADAVKFQTFKTENLILSSVEKAPYQQETTDASESQMEMLKKLEVTKEQNLELMNYCNSKGILFLTTPFDEESIDDLDVLNLAAYKVASTDLTNIPFLRKLASKQKPIILSTGMSYLEEVRLALEAIYPINQEVILLQCTANYPIEDHEANLEIMNTFKSNFDVQLGYSDHTVGPGAAPYAIPMGAKVVEKHFTLSTEDEGPDHRASLKPDELVEFVKIVRKVDSFMGTHVKKPTLTELNTRASLQKCLVANKAIRAGELFTEDNIIGKRTGGKGISPIYFDEVVGKSAQRDYAPNDIIEA